MKVGKSGLASVLLEVGEENAAVLLIRSSLPEVLDTEQDLPMLRQFGLDAEAVDELIAMIVERTGADFDHGEHFERISSERYAGLVRRWVVGRPIDAPQP